MGAGHRVQVPGEAETFLLTVYLYIGKEMAGQHILVRLFQKLMLLFLA
jgi:hypothetical protein